MDDSQTIEDSSSLSSNDAIQELHYMMEKRREIMYRDHIEKNLGLSPEQYATFLDTSLPNIPVYCHLKTYPIPHVPNMSPVIISRSQIPGYEPHLPMFMRQYKDYLAKEKTSNPRSSVTEQSKDTESNDTK